MNEKALTIKKEIRSIASHRALIISKYFLSFALLISGLYLGLIRLSATPFYILLFLYVIPIVISLSAEDHSRKTQHRLFQNIIRDKSFVLESLKTKYKYTKLRFVSNSLSYLTAIALIGLWQYNYKMQYYIPNHVKNIPVLILAVSLVIRFVGIIFYEQKLRYDLSHNKVR